MCAGEGVATGACNVLYGARCCIEQSTDERQAYSTAVPRNVCVHVDSRCSKILAAPTYNGEKIDGKSVILQESAPDL